MRVGLKKQQRLQEEQQLRTETKEAEAEIQKVVIRIRELKDEMARRCPDITRELTELEAQYEILRKKRARASYMLSKL